MTTVTEKSSSQTIHARVGQLALEVCRVRLPLQVCQSQAGFYIGTWDEFGPYSRESVEYFKTRKKADEAFATGNWTQRDHP
jgi:hypothetical protein